MGVRCFILLEDRLGHWSSQPGGGNLGETVSLVRGDGRFCPHAVASVAAALATGRAAVSGGVTSIRHSPSLEEFSLGGSTEIWKNFS